MSISSALQPTGRREHSERTLTSPRHQGLYSSVPRQKASPGQLLRRARPSDVLLSDWRRIGADHFALTVSWPDSHPFHTPVHGRHAPSLIAETNRQAARLIAHAEFDAPLDHHFLMRDLNYTIDPDQALVRADGPPLLLHLTCSEVRRQGPRLNRMTCHTVITRGGRTVATGHGSLTCTSPAAYGRLRGGRLATPPASPLPAPVPPAAVGRVSPADVVLSPTRDPLRWILRADPANPSLFARPNDHVPGMALLEAVHQAARATTGPRAFYPTALSLGFDRYAELDAPCLIEAHPAPGEEPGTVALHVTGHQDGHRVFRASLTGITGASV
ncbi:ScbA/BarX family gamma-butyrolactone biosynthesis protein [Streptomyces sp. NPDC035033]|uniref:ScbA/BarX family gamma-butyrolactone biosynthesis protein n=1 Tax=Streptomyces sp. NPDC035033 TaxID=3155368 RepID=UPI0033DDA2E4